jgi:hypothetical protein
MFGHRHEIIWHTRLASDFRASPVINKLRQTQRLAPSSHAFLPAFTVRSLVLFTVPRGESSQSQYRQIESPGFPAGDSTSAGAVKRRPQHC